MKNKDILEYLNLESNNGGNFIRITQSHQQFTKNTCNLEIGCYCIHELYKEVNTEDIIQAIRSHFVDDILPEIKSPQTKQGLKKSYNIK